MSAPVTYYSDQSSDFWPTGWMIWFCLIVGIFDVSIIGFIISQLFHK